MKKKSEDKYTNITIRFNKENYRDKQLLDVLKNIDKKSEYIKNCLYSSYNPKLDRINDRLTRIEEKLGLRTIMDIVNQSDEEENINQVIDEINKEFKTEINDDVDINKIIKDKEYIVNKLNSRRDNDEESKDKIEDDSEFDKDDEDIFHFDDIEDDSDDDDENTVSVNHFLDSLG